MSPSLITIFARRLSLASLYDLSKPCSTLIVFLVLRFLSFLVSCVGRMVEEDDVVVLLSFSGFSLEVLGFAIVCW